MLQVLTALGPIDHLVSARASKSSAQFPRNSESTTGACARQVREVASAPMGVDASPEALPVLSPELVLVSSPEEVRDALARLPEEPWRIAPAALPQRHAESVVAPPPTRAKRNKLRAVGLAALAIAGLMVGYLAGTRSADDGATSLGALRPPAVVEAPRPAPAASVAAAEKQQTRATRSANASTAPLRTRRSEPRRVPARPVQAKPTPTAPTKAKTPARTKPAAPAVRGFVPSRTWAWAPATGADTYDVTFFRGPKIVFQARAMEPRVVLPRSFRFQPGAYRWTVRALPAAAGATPIVNSTFSVTSAGARAANNAAADGPPS